MSNTAHANAIAIPMALTALGGVFLVGYVISFHATLPSMTRWFHGLLGGGLALAGATAAALAYQGDPERVAPLTGLVLLAGLALLAAPHLPIPVAAAPLWLILDTALGAALLLLGALAAFGPAASARRAAPRPGRRPLR